MAPSRAHPLLALLICGCSAPVTPPPANAPVPLPTPVASAKATPTAIPSATPAVQAPIDPAADREQLAIAQGICAAAIKHVDGKVLVGCRACPPFSGAAGHPDGIVAVDPADFYPLELSFTGAFTKAGATEIAAVFQGCESHAENFGGTLLIEKTASGYKAGNYHSGVHPDSCKPYHRADGRDLLVCQWADAHQSIGFSSVFAYDFSLSTPDEVEKGWKDLATVHDNSFQLCMGVDPTEGVNQGRVIGYRFEDKNADGKLDVVIDVEHRHTAGSAALTAKVDKACKAAKPKGDDAPSVDAAALLGKPVKASLVLIFDGQTFKATAASEKIIKGL